MSQNTKAMLASYILKNISEDKDGKKSKDQTPSGSSSISSTPTKAAKKVLTPIANFKGAEKLMEAQQLAKPGRKKSNPDEQQSSSKPAKNNVEQLSPKVVTKQVGKQTILTGVTGQHTSQASVFVQVAQQLGQKDLGSPGAQQPNLIFLINQGPLQPSPKIFTSPANQPSTKVQNIINKVINSIEKSKPKITKSKDKKSTKLSGNNKMTTTTDKYIEVENHPEQGDNSLELPNEMVDTFIHLDKAINLKRCEDKECGCNNVHCPFCDPKQHKPAIPTKIRDHMEYKHFSHGVQYKNILIIKCYKTCFGRNVCHYHCPECKNSTFLKRFAFIRHLISHARRAGKGLNIVKVPDLKMPRSISVNGFNVDLCNKECQESAKSEAHYHCPNCTSIYSDRKSIIMHLWRCQTSQNKPPPDPQYATHQALLTVQIEKAYSLTSNLPSAEDNEDIKEHISIVRTISDIPVVKCQVPNCCKSKKHCVLCKPEKYKPSYRKKLQMHHYSHWCRRVPYKGYFCLPCYSDCMEKEGKSSLSGFHFHCPVCGDTRRRRDNFKHHLTICQGEGKPLAKVPFEDDSVHVEDTSLRPIKLEEVDHFVEEEINDHMFDAADDNDEFETTNDVSKQNMNDNSAVMYEEENINSNNVKIFSTVTAEVSKSLLSVLESKGLDDLFHEVSMQTGVTYLYSPGITSPVHSLQGCLKTLTKATHMIRERLGLVDMDRQEKSTNTDNTSSINVVTEDMDEQLEDMSHIADNTPKTSESASRRKRTVTEKICDPVIKKIKQEHQYADPSTELTSKGLLDKSPSKESMQKTPSRRYSTRGVKLDFAKLLGRNTESTGTKECREVEVTKQDEAEEIVLVNENKERISLQVPKDTAAKIREKIASIESKQNDISMETEEYDNSPEETDVEENFNENLDVSLTDDKTVNNSSVNSGSTEFFVRKYNLSNSATIPKVTFDLINPKARNGSYIVRKSYKVVDKYRCKKCDFTCESFIDCSDHMVDKHPTDSIFRCDVCERHFEKQSHLKLHLEIKHGPHLEAEHLQCKYCQKGYISAYALELHIESKHQNMKRPKFSCKHCTFIGQDRSDLESHVQDNHFHQHVGVMCKECGKSFLNSSRLGQHINAVHPDGKEFKCKVCHKTFATSRYLRVHLSTHSDVRNHECPICGRKFRKRGNMISHKETHKKKEDRTYRYMCSYCGQKVNSKTNLLEHMNKHTGDRPFLCEICGKSFAYRTGVSKHKIFCHSTLTPYRCDICEKSFKIKRLLKQHMTTHTGESRFKCDSCDKMLTTASTLKMHKRKCKGLQAVQQLTNNIILLSSQNIVSEASTGESSLQNRHFVEDVIYRGNNPMKSGDASVATTVEMRADVPSDLVQVQDAPSDLAIYICSECNAVFNDFSLAEQHILVDHEQASTSNQIPPTESIMDPVHVILKEVTDAF